MTIVQALAHVAALAQLQALLDEAHASYPRHRNLFAPRPVLTPEQQAARERAACLQVAVDEAKRRLLAFYDAWAHQAANETGFYPVIGGVVEAA